jgi:hypothetical protein
MLTYDEKFTVKKTINCRNARLREYLELLVWSQETGQALWMENKKVALKRMCDGENEERE